MDFWDYYTKGLIAPKVEWPDGAPQDPDYLAQERDLEEDALIERSLTINHALVDVAKRRGIPLIHTMDSHDALG